MPRISSRSSCRSLHLERLLFVVLGLMVTLPSESASQTRPDSAALADSAHVLWNRGMDLYEEGTGAAFRLAIGQIKGALELLQRLGYRGAQGNALTFLGDLHQAVGQPDSALAYYRQGVPILGETGALARKGETLRNIGTLYSTLGQPDSTLAYYRQALAICRELDDREGEGRTLNNIGLVHQNLGQPDSALAYYRQVLPILRETGDRSVGGAMLDGMGMAHRILGQLDSALAYSRQALATYREVGDRVSEGTALINLGAMYSDLGQPDSALVCFRDALTPAREVGDRLGEGAALHQIGVMYTAVGQPDSALAYYRDALRIRREVGHRAGEGATLSGIGVVYGARSQPDSALAYYRGALTIRREVADREGEAETLHNIGVAYSDLGQPDSALAYYRDALTILREVRYRAAEGTMLHHLGLGYHRSLTLADFATAVAYYDSSAAVKGLLSEATGSDALRLGFVEQDVLLFEDWTLAWLALSKEVGRSRAVRSALAASERGRAQALLQLLRDTLAIEPGRGLAAEADSLLQVVINDGATGISYMVTPDTLLIWVAQPSGDLQVIREPISRDTLAALVNRFRRELGVDEAATRTRLARDGPELERVQFRSKIAGVKGPPGEWPTEAARQLGILLLPPELQEELSDSGAAVVVPHSAINLVPFAALPLGSSGEAMGDRFAIRYTPSLAILGEAERRPGGLASRTRRRLIQAGDPLVVGNPDMPEVATVDGSRERLSPLGGAETEAEWLGAAVGIPPLTGSRATEATVRAVLPEASLVHLATHGYAYSSESRARDSFVAFAPGGGQDGLLTVGEVLDDLPDLRADLVVLSACQTGLGDLKQAEGTVGLQRAFLAKGARSVLVSLWSVSDEATELLMQRFYTHWMGLEGEEAVEKAEALRRAQQDVRSTPGFEHPRFWAAFQLVGAG